MSRLSKAKRRAKAQKADAELWYRKYCETVLAKRLSKKQIRKARQAEAKKRRSERTADLPM